MILIASFDERVHRCQNSRFDFPTVHALCSVDEKLVRSHEPVAAAQQRARRLYQGVLDDLEACLAIAVWLENGEAKYIVAV